MNGDIEASNKGRLIRNNNNWGIITDVKSDNRLFEAELSGQSDWAPISNPLRCLHCNLEFFCEKQHLIHHLGHVSDRKLYVLLVPINCKALKLLAAGKSVKKRPGPRSKTEGFPPPQAHSPLKLTIKRLSTCHEPAFEVVSKKKSKDEVTAMDGLIPEGLGVDPPDSPTPSPTPSEILRQEVHVDPHRSTWESLAVTFGFLAPESLEPSVDQGAEVQPTVNGNSTEDIANKEDSGASSNGDPDPAESAFPPPPELVPAADKPLVNGISDSEPDAQKGTESSDSGCEKDGSEKDYPGCENNAACSDSTPPQGLTILAPSAVNSSVNGSLPSEPLDSNTVSETLSSLSNDQESPTTSAAPSPVPEKVGLTVKVKSAEALGVTTNASVNLFNTNTTSNDPLGLLRGYVEPDNFLETCEVCGDRSGNLEEHRATMGHYKCLVAPECGPIVFPTAAERATHQQVAHSIVPPPPTQPSLQQLQQQVQRIPVPYGVPLPGMGTPPPPVSPGYRIPGGITLTYPSTGQASPTAAAPPVQGIIQARPFALATSPSSIRPDGSPVSSPALPPNLSRSISISPSTKPGQKRSASSPVVDTAKRNRSDSPDCELVDVQQPLPSLPSSISLTVRGSGGNEILPNKESSGVANILASRGITMMPAANKPATPPSARTITAPPATTLNLSSAVSILPASQARSQFAVPQGRSTGRQVTTTIKPPTVDLTQDSPPTFRRNRPQRFTCQVCDKVFQSQETLNQHLTTHRSPGKLPYKCSLCNAQYPTQQGLMQHKQTYHKEAQGSEMALPVVDMKHPGTMQKLASLGIRHCLVLSQLVGNSASGMFGIPIVAIDNARNPAVCNLAALGASNVLSLGPAKALR